MYHVGLITHILHDVDLTVERPGGEVLRHHPEGRPGSLSTGHPQARLKVTVGPALYRVNPCRNDVTAALSGDDL